MALLQAQPRKQLRAALDTPVLWSDVPGGALASAVFTVWAGGVIITAAAVRHQTHRRHEAKSLLPHLQSI